MCLPPPMSKNFASTGLGSSRSARVGSADRFATAETRRRQKAGRSVLFRLRGLETKGGEISPEVVQGSGGEC